MRALVYEKPAVANIKEIPKPSAGDHDAVVRMTRFGICHSDFDLLSGHYILPVNFPIIPGHEWVGEIVEIGKAVTNFSRGDRVVGECSVADDQHFGFTISGAAAEYFIVPVAWLHRIPTSINETIGALVEPFTVAYGATHNIDPSDDVVIFGGGTIGLCAVAAASGRGARVIVVEPNPVRRELAKKLGATETVDPLEANLADVISDLTGGKRGSFIVEASGVPAAMAATLEVAGYGAHIVNVGINVGGTAISRPGLIVERALNIRGQVGSVGVWPQAIRFLDRIQPDLSLLVTKTFKLSEGLAALEAAEDRVNNLKIHVSPDN
jgi:2-desacetyl-2-hydroxyethyl bacteriochlorophyllide A dehydrogenase